MSDEEWVILFMLCGKASEWIGQQPAELCGTDNGFPQCVINIAERLELKGKLKSFVSWYDNGL